MVSELIDRVDCDLTSREVIRGDVFGDAGDDLAIVVAVPVDFAFFAILS